MTARVSRWAAFLLVCAFLSLSCIASAHAAGDRNGAKKFTGWWELGGFYGTDDSSRGEVVLFTPLMQSATTLFFLDARGKLFEDDVQEANLALGYRQMMASGWNLGLWAGWDIRDTTNDNTFNQVAFGVEALSERYDLRVNGYAPITDPKGSPSLAEVVLQGNNIFMIGGEEVALYGVDAEVGVLLFGGTRGGGGSKGAPARARRHELRAYAGGFWFDADDALEEVAGPKGRLEYRINDVVSSLPGSRLTLESELSHDEVRDTRFEIGARLRIPFGTRESDAASRVASLTAQELRMTEGLERDTDIVTAQSKEENVIDDATNVAMNAVSYAQNANEFANAVNQGGNRLIVVQDNGQQIDVSATDGQALQDNQTVQGGSSTILMRGAKSGTVAGFRAPGKRPTLFTNDVNFNTGAITVADNTHVAGLNILGDGDQTTPNPGNLGIHGLGSLDNVVIEQMDIRNMGDDAISFVNGNSNLRITHTVISDIGNEGVDFLVNNENINISHVQIANTGGEGIAVSFQNDNVTIDNVEIVNPDDNGIQFAIQNTNVLITDTTITGGAQGMQHGIIMQDQNDVTIRNVRIADADFDGIELSASFNIVNMRDVTITGAGQNGVHVAADGNTLSIRNSTVRDAGLDGLQIDVNNQNINMEDTTFTGVFGDDVIQVSNAGNTLGGTGNIFNGTFGNQFCNVTGAQTGSFGFDVAPQPTCP